MHSTHSYVVCLWPSLWHHRVPLCSLPPLWLCYVHGFFFIVCLGVLDLGLDKTAKRGHNLSLWWSEQRQAVESLACHLSSTPLCRTTGQWQLGQQWCPPTLFCIFESFSPLHHLINYWPDFCGFSLHTSALAPNMFSATGVRYLPQSQKNGNFL